MATISKHIFNIGPYGKNRGEDFKTFFPIGSYVKTTVCPLKIPILDGGQGHWTQF
jgi:hypothetical protein